VAHFSVPLDLAQYWVRGVRTRDAAAL
jgi:hypothetical protein